MSDYAEFAQKSGASKQRVVKETKTVPKQKPKAEKEHSIVEVKTGFERLLGEMRKLYETTQVRETRCPDNPSLKTVMMPRDTFHKIIKVFSEAMNYGHAVKEYSDMVHADNLALNSEMKRLQSLMLSVIDESHKTLEMLDQSAQIQTALDKRFTVLDDIAASTVSIIENLETHFFPEHRLQKRVQLKEMVADKPLSEKYSIIHERVETLKGLVKPKFKETQQNPKDAETDETRGMPYRYGEK